MTDRRSLLGLLMVGLSLVLSTWALYHLIRTGNCGSGGAVVYTRACPSGTGLRILGLMAAIFLALGGAGVARSAAVGVLWFGMFFTLAGLAALLVGVGPASPPGSQGTGIFLAVLFTGVMGLPVVGIALKIAGSEQTTRKKDDGGVHTTPPSGIGIN